MKSDPVLDELIGYKLKRAALATDEDARRALAPFGVTPAKLTALMLIRANPGCGQTMLGRALDVNRSSAMKLVNVLSDLGLIKREPGRDARTNALFLLPHGEAQVTAMLAALRHADELIVSRLGAEDSRLLADLLAKLKRPRARSRESGRTV